MHRFLLFILVALLLFVCLAIDAQRSRAHPGERAPEPAALDVSA